MYVYNTAGKNRRRLSMYVYMIGASVSPNRKQGTTAVAVEKSKKPVFGGGSDASDSSVRRYQKSRE
jgi:hypothetical protein